jgi:glycosyltransferase involved in cell wall biosynthesis
MVKKILIINWRDIKNPEAGGAEMYYHEIFRRMVPNGFEITVLAHSFKGAPESEIIDGIKVIRKGNRFLFNFSAIGYLIGNYRKFDLIIEDINKIPFFTPLFVHHLRLHMVMHFFRGSIFREANFIFALYVYLMESMISLFYRKERFVAISESTRSDIMKFGIPKDRITIVEPGIDTSYFYPSQPKSRPPVLVYVGRLMKYKNVQFIIRALPELRKRVEGVTLEIGGWGDYIDDLRRIAENKGVADAVVFSGRITEEYKRDLLSKASLFVNPSAKEGWGINNIEANLCGTISLSSNVAGLRDSVQDGVTGLLYEPENIEDFCEKAASVLLDSKKRESLERNAIERARELSWEKISQKMEELIKHYR